MDESTQSQEFGALVEQCRARCLWFTRQEHLPGEREAQLELLRLIERYGTRDDFIRARRLREWLLQSSNAAFSVS